MLVTTLANLGTDQIPAGELRGAIAYLREALRVAEAHGYRHLAAGVAVNLGFTYLLDGDAANARPLLISVLDAARATGEKTYVNVAILGLALAVGPDGDPAVAATLHGAADHQYEQAGQAFDDRRRSDCAPATMPGCATRWVRLRSMPPTSVAALSAKPMPRPWPWDTAQPDPGPAPAVAVPAVHDAPSDGPAGPLSARERQIMALLAGGASNAQIAQTLFVTPNTVRTHLDRIRDKTGARNRAELTRYAIQTGIEPVVPSR